MSNITLSFGPKKDCSSELVIETRDVNTDTLTISCGFFSDGIDYPLSREEARKVWEHLGSEFGFSR